VLAGFRQPRNLIAIDYDTLQVAAGLRSRDGNESLARLTGGRQYVLVREVSRTLSLRTRACFATLKGNIC